MRPAKDGGSRFGIVLNSSPLFMGGRLRRERDPPLRARKRLGGSDHRPAHRHLRQPEERKGKVQLIDLFGNFEEAEKDGRPISRIFRNEDFGHC